jgi:hypothetical protein
MPASRRALRPSLALVAVLLAAAAVNPATYISPGVAAARRVLQAHCQAAVTLM